MSHRSITDVVVHVVWSTLERRSILDASHDAILAWVLAEKARVMGSRLLGCGFASDHAHVAVTLDPKVRLADLIQRLKGASAYELSRSDTWPTPLRWQAGYWAEAPRIGRAQPLRRRSIFFSRSSSWIMWVWREWASSRFLAALWTSGTRVCSVTAIWCESISA